MVALGAAARKMVGLIAPIRIELQMQLAQADQGKCKKFVAPHMMTEADKVTAGIFAAPFLPRPRPSSSYLSQFLEASFWIDNIDPIP